AHPKAVRGARGARRGRRRCRQRRGAPRARVGRARRPVHQRGAHHGLGVAQTARRTLGDRHRDRCRLPHRDAIRRAAVSDDTVERAPGLSVRLKLTLSYAGFLMLAGVLMLAAVWVVVLRYIPDGVLSHMHPSLWFLLDRSDPLNGFGSVAVIVLAMLLVFGLVGGWFLAGRMLAPLT